MNAPIGPPPARSGRQVPLAIAITWQSGPAMKLVGPIVLAALLGYGLIASAIG
jgi:hypothetical protein